MGPCSTFSAALKTNLSITGTSWPFLTSPSSPPRLAELQVEYCLAILAKSAPSWIFFFSCSARSFVFDQNMTNNSSFHLVFPRTVALGLGLHFFQRLAFGTKHRSTLSQFDVFKRSPRSSHTFHLLDHKPIKFVESNHFHPSHWNSPAG